MLHQIVDLFGITRLQTNIETMGFPGFVLILQPKNPVVKLEK